MSGPGPVDQCCYIIPRGSCVLASRRAVLHAVQHDVLDVLWHSVWSMLRLAMKSIPLKHDEAELKILYEDEHLLAVNKTPGVLTAPKHRFVVGSYTPASNGTRLTKTCIDLKWACTLLHPPAYGVSLDYCAQHRSLSCLQPETLP